MIVCLIALAFERASTRIIPGTGTDDNPARLLTKENAGKQYCNELSKVVYEWGKSGFCN